MRFNMRIGLLSAQVISLASVTACNSADSGVILKTPASRLSSYNSNGVSIDDLKSTCGGLAQTIASEVVQMRALEKTAEIEKKAPPSTLQEMWGRATRQDNAGPASQNYAKARNKITALNAELKDRGCRPVEIEPEFVPS